MGRHNISVAIPQRQRSCLPADRELRMAIKGHMPKAFGVRRLVEDESAAPLIERFREMQDDGIVSEDIEPRAHLQVTLLPRRRLDRQLKRGLVLGYEFGKAITSTHHEMQQVAKPSLEVTLGKITVIKSRFIAFGIENPQLQKEYDATEEILGRFGVKGVFKENRVPLHVTLGESPNFIAQKTQSELIGQLNEVMQVGETVKLQDLEIYHSVRETP